MFIFTWIDYMRQIKKVMIGRHINSLEYEVWNSQLFTGDVFE